MRPKPWPQVLSGAVAHAALRWSYRMSALLCDLQQDFADARLLLCSSHLLHGPGSKYGVKASESRELPASMRARISRPSRPAASRASGELDIGSAERKVPPDGGGGVPDGVRCGRGVAHLPYGPLRERNRKWDGERLQRWPALDATQTRGGSVRTAMRVVAEAVPTQSTRRSWVSVTSAGRSSAPRTRSAAGLGAAACGRRRYSGQPTPRILSGSRARLAAERSREPVKSIRRPS